MKRNFNKVNNRFALVFGGCNCPRVSHCPRHSTYLFSCLHERDLLRVKVVGIQELLRGLLLGQVVKVAVVLGEEGCQVRLREGKKAKEEEEGARRRDKYRSIDRA